MRWVRVRRGAYLPVADAPASSGEFVDRRQMHLARIAAIASQSSASPAFSHESAALVRGAQVWRVPQCVHVTQRSSASGRRGADIARHKAILMADDVEIRSGVLVTSGVRTLVDCMMTLPPLSALVVADSLLSQGIDPDSAALALTARGHRRGVRRARMILAEADGAAESAGETALRYLLWAYGFPRPELQVRVDTRLGTFWADLGWRRWGVLIEYDGLVKYGSLAGGAPSDVVVKEKRRQEAMEEEGFRVLRVTKFDLQNPGQLVARVIKRLPPSVHLTPIPELLLPSSRR